MNKTIAVCGKCGKTKEWNAAKTDGWLIASIPDTDGYMIIRCVEHITGHALRKAGLPQQAKSKRVADNINRGLWIEICDGHIVSAIEIEPGNYALRFGAWRMPPDQSVSFSTLPALILEMRKVEPDLRKWNLVEV